MSALVLAPEDLTMLVEEIWSSLLEASPDVSAEVPLEGELVIAGVDISGCWEGAVVVQTDRPGAVAIAATLLLADPEDLRAADLSDAVGEVANIIGGSVKGCLDGTAALSLPWVRTDAVGAVAEGGLQVRAAWRGHPLRVSVVPAEGGTS